MAYLRPEDLREVYTKKNGNEIWTDYRKSKGGRKGETTEPRKLMPIWVVDTDGTPAEWNYTLKARVADGESLPPLGKSSRARGAIGTYLKRQKIWQRLKEESKQEREVLTPYSFMHRFAYYGNNRPQEDGMYRAPKKLQKKLGLNMKPIF